MRRTITDQLIDWNTSARRQPLLLRGARQVGKTWAVTDFAQRHMPGRLHLVDFERDVEWRRFFEGNLDIDRILGALELAMGRSIAVGQDLLFLDEIQACPRAVVALRYFYEQLPQLRVVAAGSLIEFALGSISFPVGRVQMLPVHPLSFLEFLWARGNEPAADVVRAVPATLVGRCTKLSWRTCATTCSSAACLPPLRPSWRPAVSQRRGACRTGWSAHIGPTSPSTRRASIRPASTRCSPPSHVRWAGKSPTPRWRRTTRTLRSSRPSTHCAGRVSSTGSPRRASPACLWGPWCPRARARRSWWIWASCTHSPTCRSRPAFDSRIF